MGRPYLMQSLCSLICILLFLTRAQGSALLDSLTCVNNYKTHWICQWKESIEAHKLLPMSLYYLNDLNSNTEAQRCNHSVIQRDGEHRMTCRINEKFITAMNSKYTFQPERSVHLEAHIIPASKLRMPSPVDVLVKESANGLIVVSWKMPDYISSHISVLYQVTYRRKHWETWEDAVLLNVLGNMEVSFRPELFVPGSTYLFRVRSVSDEDHLFRSSWSKESAWTKPQVDESVPNNLHCEYDGLAQMRCSWEMRKELITSVSYMLYYNESPTDGSSNTSASPTKEERLCVGKSSAMKDGVPHVQFSCSLQVPSSQSNNSFHVQVRLQEEVKSIKPCEHIQTEPPTDLTIQDGVSDGYILRWNQPKVESSTIQLTYQLCYWKQGDPECPDQFLVNVSGNLPEYYFPSSELQGSTNYKSRIRAKPNGKSGYNGPWSEWSEGLSWKTSRVVDTMSICLATFFISIVFLACVYQGFRYLKRLRQKWNDSLPNPSNSKILSSHPVGYWHLNFSPFIERDFYIEKEQPSVCHQISPKATPEPTTEEVDDPVITISSDPNVCPLEPNPEASSIEQNVQTLQSNREWEDPRNTHDMTERPISQPARDASSQCYNRFSSTHAQLMSSLVKNSGYFSFSKSHANLLIAPNKVTPSCQTQTSEGQMGYVLNMEKQFPPQKPQMPNEKIPEPANNSYFAIPPPSDFQISPKGPLMIINPDGTGPLVLKQVGDYCFFPGLQASQEHLEGKLAPSSGQKEQRVPQEQPLPAVQTFKVIQRGYLALEKT